MLGELITFLIALWLMAQGAKMCIRIVFPKFNYGMIGKPIKKGFKFAGKFKKGGKLGKPLYKLLYGNQKDKRGRSFAWFHFSLIGSLISTVIYFVYDGNLLVVLGMWFLAGLLYKVHTWVKAKTRRPLPGRQRR